MLHFRRIMMMANALPKDYEPLEYLQVSNTYLDTNIKPTANTRVVMDAQLTETPSALSNAVLFGTAMTLSSNAYAFYYSGAQKLFTAEIFSSSVNDQKYSVDASARVVVDFNKDYIAVNGDSRTVVQGSLSSSQNLTLFALLVLSAKTYAASCKFYGCQIYEGTTLVRDYVPAKKNGTNGIYDKVNKTFTTL